MNTLRIFTCRSLLMLGGSLVVATAAHAQESPESAIDALIDSSSSSSRAITSAKAQASSGDITGAAATLERALLADPNANDARLYYASMLCKLDDPQAARIELTKLDSQKTGDAAWNDMNSACGGSMVRPVPPAGGDATGLSGEAFVGVTYDSDVVGGYLIQTPLALVAPLSGSGFGAEGGIRITGRGNNYASSGDVYAGFAWRSKRNIDGPKQSYDIGEMKLGFGRTDFSIGLVARHYRLFNAPYVWEYGAQGEFDIRAGEAGRIAIRAEAVNQEYQVNGPFGGDGMRYDLSATYEKTVADSGFLALGIGLELKDAKTRSAGYVGGRIFGGLQLPVGEKGQYLNLSGTLRYIDFRDPVSFYDRRDTRAFARAAYGIPIGTSGFTLEGAVNYSLRTISSPKTGPVPPLAAQNVAKYNNFGGELRLVWKF
jgi:Tetratricopeptide repeat